MADTYSSTAVASSFVSGMLCWVEGFTSVWKKTLVFDKSSKIIDILAVFFRTEVKPTLGYLSDTTLFYFLSLYVVRHV